ncbi:hypothetical protein ACFL5O_09160 [Myxococcota bacterium]
MLPIRRSTLLRLLASPLSAALDPAPLTEAGCIVLVADGLKVAKEGRKMPAVQCLHQESQNNSRAEYIVGYSFQVVSLLVTAATGQVVAVPLPSRI